MYIFKMVYPLETISFLAGLNLCTSISWNSLYANKFAHLEQFVSSCKYFLVKSYVKKVPSKVFSLLCCFNVAFLLLNILSNIQKGFEFRYKVDDIRLLIVLQILVYVSLNMYKICTWANLSFIRDIFLRAFLKIMLAQFMKTEPYSPSGLRLDSKLKMVLKRKGRLGQIICHYMDLIKFSIK